MKSKLVRVKQFVYITVFLDVRSLGFTDTFLHTAQDLPHAIKAGRKYVRDQNRQIGRKIYYYQTTYRSR